MIHNENAVKLYEELRLVSEEENAIIHSLTELGKSGRKDQELFSPINKEFVKIHNKKMDIIDKLQLLRID